MSTGGHLVVSGVLGTAVGGVASAFTTPGTAALIGLLVFLAYWGVIVVGDLDL